MKIAVCITFLTVCFISGCTVIKVADAAAGVAVSASKTAVKVGAKTVGTAVDVVTPDAKEKVKE